MNVIVYKRADGGTSVCHLAAAVEVEDAMGKLPAGATDISIRDAADVPDGPFFDALLPDLTIDMTKARDIWRNRMREARAPLLAALDIEYQRADETGDAEAKADVAARKQVLRDVTEDPAIGAAATAEDLKAVWPEVLG